MFAWLLFHVPLTPWVGWRPCFQPAKTMLLQREESCCQQAKKGEGEAWIKVTSYQNDARTRSQKLSEGILEAILQKNIHRRSNTITVMFQTCRLPPTNHPRKVDIEEQNDTMLRWVSSLPDQMPSTIQELGTPNTA